MSDAAETFIAFLADKGLRYTSQRRLILEEVFALHRHFDADGLFMRLRGKGYPLSRTSVYRTLPLLEEAGLIRKTRCTDDHAFYEHTLGHAHHDHLVCLECGKVVEFTNDQVEAIQEKLCRKHGFRMADHTFVIRGYCRRCR